MIQLSLLTMFNTTNSFFFILNIVTGSLMNMFVYLCSPQKLRTICVCVCVCVYSSPCWLCQLFPLFTSALLKNQSQTAMRPPNPPHPFPPPPSPPPPRAFRSAPTTYGRIITQPHVCRPAADRAAQQPMRRCSDRPSAGSQDTGQYGL